MFSFIVKFIYLNWNSYLFPYSVFQIMEWFVLSSALNIFLASAMEQLATTPSKTENEARNNVSTSCNDFTKTFYNELSSTNDGNIVTSPLSIHMILSHLSHGADSTTLDEFTKVLCHYDKNSIKEGYQSLITQLNEIKDVKLHTANRMYIQNEFELSADFVTVGEEVYQSEIAKVDFKLNADVVSTINNWIKEKTKNKILDVVSPADLNEDTKLVLINVIYFNGSWLHTFKERSTQNRIFHVTRDRNKLVPTMFNKSKYNHGNIPKLHAKFIEIPYANEDITMTIILPDEIDGLSNLQNVFLWEELANAPRDYNDVKLYLPKFKIEFTLNLKSILQKLGLNTMFEQNANLSRISKVPLVVSKVLQKVVIEVSEKGTEAAAATVAVMRLRRMIDMDEPQEFLVDRPFMFIIEYKPNKIPLFIGHVKDIDVTSQKDEL